MSIQTSVIPPDIGIGKGVSHSAEGLGDHRQENGVASSWLLSVCRLNRSLKSLNRIWILEITLYIN